MAALSIGILAALPIVGALSIGGPRDRIGGGRTSRVLGGTQVRRAPAAGPSRGEGPSIMLTYVRQPNIENIETRYIKDRKS